MYKRQHIHFEVRDCDLNPISPFEHNMWSSPPVYDTPFGVMGLYLKDGSFSGVDNIKDPPPDLETLNGNLLGVAVNAGGGDASTSFNIVITRPDQSVYVDHTHSYTQVHRHAMWHFNWVIPSVEGVWTVSVKSGGVTLATQQFTR